MSGSAPSAAPTGTASAGASGPAMDAPQTSGAVGPAAGRDWGQEPALALVLVVDDDADIRGVVAEILREEGHAVVEAGNGAEALATLEALAAARRAPPALILLDMRMPVLDG